MYSNHDDLKRKPLEQKPYYVSQDSRLQFNE